ncbi:hypothetical protein LWC35_32595 [Pseudonocardia kujensis]|uniref:hypothetical protein n=1 Tax=Pseudonocardia kujensis TaxID=1128675 RepID=UPI001E58A64B|nr:hypothetical protein [Pseudonocardia kujensis]MCE0767601.1 hypothetical protein [Pseudonocardia kujensis]
MQQTLVRMAQGHPLSQAPYIAAKLGVADALAAARSTRALADTVGARADKLTRVVREWNVGRTTLPW